MEVIQTIFYFIVTIGILVLVHELGHFLTAKMFGMRVDVFSIGFPPRAFGKKIGDTDYCVSWIPIGGYVKIAGMIDESMDTEFLNKEPQPWEFRSKPIWQRMIVMSGGVIMNVLLAVAIFWGIIYYQGKYIQPNTSVGYVEPGGAAERAGLRAGDYIVSLNNNQVKRWDDIERIIFTDGMATDVAMNVKRGSEEVSLVVAKDSLPNVLEERFGIAPKGLAAQISAVESGKPAQAAGITAGDVIVTFNGDTINYFALVPAIKSSAGTTIALGIIRGKESHTINVIPNEEGRIGVALGAKYIGPEEHVTFTLFSAFPEGVKDVYFTTGIFLKNMYQIVVGQVSFTKSVGGPVRIAQIATQSAERGIVSFLGFMALLSMSLALLNILPFPALDGGHILILTVEAAIRREIPPKIKIAVQQAGFFILLAFMAFVVYNDIANF